MKCRFRISPLSARISTGIPKTIGAPSPLFSLGYSVYFWSAVVRRRMKIGDLSDPGKVSQLALLPLPVFRQRIMDKAGNRFFFNQPVSLFVKSQPTSSQILC